MKIADYVIPVLFFITLILSAIKKKNAYGAFVDGSKNAINLVCEIFPYILTVLVAVHVFRACGLAETLANSIGGAFEMFGIPRQLCELIIIRPVSGAGALAVLENVYSVYGVDSYIGKCASIVYGSSETVFYVCAVYLSGIKKKKILYAIPLSLAATFIGYIVGCAVIKMTII